MVTHISTLYNKWTCGLMKTITYQNTALSFPIVCCMNVIIHTAMLFSSFIKQLSIIQVKRLRVTNVIYSVNSTTEKTSMFNYFSLPPIIMWVKTVVHWGRKYRDIRCWWIFCIVENDLITDEMNDFELKWQWNQWFRIITTSSSAVV